MQRASLWHLEQVAGRVRRLAGRGGRGYGHDMAWDMCMALVVRLVQILFVVHDRRLSSDCASAIHAK
jgi:hypothetical protein